MAHVAEGTLRRLVDEPLAVPDTAAAHVASCRRCTRRQGTALGDSLFARSHLSPLLPAPDVDAAWQRLRAAAPAGDSRPARSRAAGTPRPPASARWRWRIAVPPRLSPALLALVAVLLAGAAAGTTLTIVLGSSPAPSPAPSALPTADFQAVADVTGLAGPGGILGGLQGDSGSLRLPFGVLRWSAAGPAHKVASIAAAEAATGLTVRIPSLPAGVGGPATVLVQPAVTATVTFGDGAPAGLQGTSLTLRAGPAVVVEYGGQVGNLGIPTLASFAMGRPTLSSGTASPQRLAAYVLAQPGLPSGLVQEVRLVSGLGTILPVGARSGPGLSQVDVDGAPGILVTEGTVASGVIWQDRAGVVRAVLGLLDQKDVLHVADQLG